MYSKQIVAIFFSIILLSGITGAFSPTTAYAEPNKVWRVYVEELPSWASIGNALEYSFAFWEKRDNIKFELVGKYDSPDFIIQWVKDFGQSKIGHALYSKWVEASLGDSNCNGQWNAFQAMYVRNLLIHEIGHAIGYDHETQGDSYMHPIIQDKRYGMITFQKTIPENWWQIVPLCVYSNSQKVFYSVESSSKNSGFNVYIVPSYGAVEKSKANKPFSVYPDGTCQAENVVSFGGVCNVGLSSYLFINGVEESTTVTIKIQDRTDFIKNFKVYDRVTYEKPSTVTNPTDFKEKDSDGDGIPDNVDSCKYEAENFNLQQDSDGCPESNLTFDKPNDSRNVVNVNWDFLVNSADKYYSTNVDGTKESVANYIYNGKISVIVPDYDRKSLLYVINPTMSGGIATVLPKDLFNTINALGNEQISVYIDGKQEKFHVIDKGWAKVIYVYFKADAKAIEIRLQGLNLTPKTNSDTLSNQPVQAKITPTTDLNSDLDKARSLKPSYQEKLDVLRKGINTSEKSLSGLQYQNPEAQKKIDDAWSVRWHALERLDSAREYFDLAEANLGNGNFKKSLYWYDEIDVSSNAIEDDLKWISKAIADAEKLEEEHKSQGFLAFAFNSKESKNCIWFICW